MQTSVNALLTMMLISQAPYLRMSDLQGHHLRNEPSLWKQDFATLSTVWWQRKRHFAGQCISYDLRSLVRRYYQELPLRICLLLIGLQLHRTSRLKNSNACSSF